MPCERGSVRARQSCGSSGFGTLDLGARYYQHALAVVIAYAIKPWVWSEPVRRDDDADGATYTGFRAAKWREEHLKLRGKCTRQSTRILMMRSCVANDTAGQKVEEKSTFHGRSSVLELRISYSKSSSGGQGEPIEAIDVSFGIFDGWHAPTVTSTPTVGSSLASAAASCF